jgi:hypothetical protein
LHARSGTVYVVKTSRFSEMQHEHTVHKDGNEQGHRHGHGHGSGHGHFLFFGITATGTLAFGATDS